MFISSQSSAPSFRDFTLVMVSFRQSSSCFTPSSESPAVTRKKLHSSQRISIQVFKIIYIFKIMLVSTCIESLFKYAKLNKTFEFVPEIVLKSLFFFFFFFLEVGLLCVTMCACLFSCEEDLPLAVLLLFCSEGDNIPDAFALVNHLNDWLHLLDDHVNVQKFQRPSWSLLFGSGIPPALF
uniref:Proteasome assembly chaperone 2 n=1 Tax=Amphilophus citrinellus TaxID=61819 RepID=A0A3Q0SMB5_AMPCI